ncbi:unnamed protein product [Periconia digitata]|uniref:Uncharacterized protein n=1 Tax=Periconia digitata TaxID=1303443 RepID=A0A9W4XFC7_9PLEO|nr:unnamed protein product [Periconia digitata]
MLHVQDLWQYLVPTSHHQSSIPRRKTRRTWQIILFYHIFPRLQKAQYTITMLPTPIFLLTCVFAITTHAFPTNSAAVNGTNGCPTSTEYACFDVINSSLCLGQKAVNGTAEELAACVDYPGGMSDLPGSSKLCRCPGCHSTFINEAIEKLFPPPCA